LAWAFSSEQTAKAIPLLDRALLLDPGYAAVHGLAAFCHLRGFAWGNLSDAEKATGVRHARTVLSADTDDAAALAFSALGVGFMDRDSDAACSAIEKALTLNPNSAQAFGLGAAVYSVVGHLDTVVKYAQRSMQLSPFDPLHFVTLNALSRAHFLSSRYEEAIDAAQRALQVNPQFAPAYVWLIGSHVHLKRKAQALERKQRLLSIDPNFRFARWIGFTIAPAEHQQAIALSLREAGVPE